MTRDMKILIFLVLLYLNVCFCTSQFTGDIDKVSPNSKYPKKVRPSLIQYHNQGKYFKALVDHDKPLKPNNNTGYTAFPKVYPNPVAKDFQIVPDSPYFPIDDPRPQEKRSRIKKVLQESKVLKESKVLRESPVYKRFKRDLDAADSPVKKEIETPFKEDIQDSNSLKKEHTTVLKAEDASEPKKEDTIAPKTETIKKEVSLAPIKKEDSNAPKVISNAPKIKSNALKLNANAPKIISNALKKVNTKVSALSKGVATGSNVKKLKVPTKTRSKNLKSNKISLKRSKRNKTAREKTVSGDSKKLKQPTKKLNRPLPSRSKKRNTRVRRQNGTLALKNQKKVRLQGKSISVRGKKGKKRLASSNGAARSPKGAGARRLIAARDALIEEYPYTISIQKDGNHWCSGAILNQRLIITTANCLWKSSSISRMRVRVGSRHTDRGGQVAKIQEVMKHPGWRIRKNPDNDVALAVLDKTIRFSHSLHGVDLPNRVMMPPFDDVWVTSWGSERNDGIYDPYITNTLQVYHNRLMERDKCSNITARFGVLVNENFICLAQTGKRAPCTRDTGAPAVSDGVLWGLASWGIRKLCGTERYPAMFSYLASQSNMDFIANATHLLMSEEREYPYPDRYPLKKIVLAESPSTS